jgi:RNA polymerase sigma factor (sigma-70 family)
MSCCQIGGGTTARRPIPAIQLRLTTLYSLRIWCISDLQGASFATLCLYRARFWPPDTWGSTFCCRAPLVAVSGHLYTPAMDPEELVRAASQGDEEAWRALVDRYSGLVWSIARGHSLNESDSADVSQTTWLRLAESLTRIEAPDRIAAWLATCARRESLRVLRLRRGDVPIDESHDEIQSPSSPEQILMDQANGEELWRAFQSLPLPCRALLRAMLVEPAPTYSELAQAFGMPIGSIGPTRARCLERLRAAMLASRNNGDDSQSGSQKRRRRVS